MRGVESDLDLDLDLDLNYDSEEIDSEREEDLRDHLTYELDWRLLTIYGDMIHRNNRWHLHRGVENNKAISTARW